MIPANVAAAETLEKNGSAADLPRPRRARAAEKIHALREFLPTLDLPSARPAQCGPPISTACSRRSKAHDAEQLVNEMVLRSQAQAEYAAENYGHFGLNLRRYAHFTSPIRRYADLIVHRALIRALGLGEADCPRRDAANADRHRASTSRPPSAAR